MVLSVSPPLQPQLQREPGHIIGMPVADVETGGGQVAELGGTPATAATPSPAGSDVEMQLMRPPTALVSADQEALASATCLLDLKCWQDLPSKEAGVHDNRWLLSVQRLEANPPPDGQTQP